MALKLKQSAKVKNKWILDEKITRYRIKQVQQKIHIFFDEKITRYRIRQVTTKIQLFSMKQ